MSIQIVNINQVNLKAVCSLLFFLLLFPVIHAQKTERKPAEKISPLLALQLKTGSPKGINAYTVAITDLNQFKTLLQHNQTIKLISVYEPAKIAVIECSWVELEKLLENPVLLAVDQKKKPKEELLFGFIDYAANKISTIQNRFPLLNGNTINLSVKEQQFDTTDIDFKGRILPSLFAAPTGTSHASIMATMMAGGGNSWYNTKGAAWKSKLSSASFLNLLPEPDSYYQSSGIFIQNHSYGTVIENYYGSEAAGYDASVISNNSLLHIFSVGNSGSATSTTGNYAGIAGYSTLTGNFKQAKNIITVGHIDSFGIVLSPSSKGPAYDGRVKPELVAFGEDGSSGATALVSGVAAVLHQTYKEKTNGTMAPASLMKAVLLNSADDVDAAGIDFKSGYGSLNAYKAVHTILNGRYFQGTVSNNTQQQFPIIIPAGIKQVKLTLVWTDPQAIPNSAKALVNDLDVELKNKTTGTIWQPWVLNSSANITALQQPPSRKRDSLNTVEQITVDNPLAGVYELTVKGYAIPSGTQNFSIAYQLDSVDTFNWYFPTAADHLFPAQTNVLRFESGFNATSGRLEISTDNGTNWQLVSNNADITKGYYQLPTPDSFGKALLRMTINNQSFTTDTFTISKRITASVGFNCVDSFLIAWPKVATASAYQVYRLGAQYMEPLVITTDTFAVFSKITNTAKHYAIAPLLNNLPALSTYTFNYELQGTGCYFKSLLANLNNANQGELTLELGTTYHVKSISFEKQTSNGFRLLDKQTTITGFQYQSLDKFVTPGTNTYRAVVELTDGRFIYSTFAIIYFVGSSSAVIYPNPVQQNGSLTILSKQDGQLIFQLIDNMGRLVLQKQLVDSPEQLSLLNLPGGIYHYRLLRDAKKVQSGSIIIR